MPATKASQASAKPAKRTATAAAAKKAAPASGNGTAPAKRAAKASPAKATTKAAAKTTPAKAAKTMLAKVAAKVAPAKSQPADAAAEAQQGKGTIRQPDGEWIEEAFDMSDMGDLDDAAKEVIDKMKARALGKKQRCG